MTHINQRRDLAVNWTASNPILQEGEVGWETDTRKSKLGDGVTRWNALAYTTAAVAVTKADVGLGQVDNTADLDKPISALTQAALDAQTAALGAFKYTLLSNGTDLNTLTATGNYRGNSLVNTPASTTGGFVQVSGNGGTYCVQVMTNYASTRTFRRTNNAGAWSAWIEQANTDQAQALTNKTLTDPTNVFPPLGLIGVVTFTANGNFTKATYPGLQAIRIRAVGGGGQGGGAALTAASQAATGGPGGSGGYVEKYIAASALAASEAVTIGAGGTTGAAGANGQAGGNTTFGAWLTASGGGGGVAGSAHTPPGSSGGGAGTGGAATGGDINIPGGAGDDGFSLSISRAVACGGPGTPLGGPGRTIITAAASRGAAGGLYGGGGGGAANAQSQATATAGNVGGNGILIVELYR